MPNTCIYEGRTYSDGSQVCQAGEIHRCDDGSWTNLHFDCDQVTDDPAIKGVENWIDSEILSLMEAGRSASAGASAQCPANTPTGVNVMVRGTHQYQLRNTSAAAANFSILLRLEDDKGHSFQELRTFTLAPGQGENGSAQSFFQAAYDVSEIGPVRVAAITGISGAASEVATGTCSFAVFRG